MEKEKLKLEDLEIHCESLIEFSSLTKVLLELIKRQKKTENKLQEHDYIINLLKNDKNIDTDFFMNNKENDISLNIESDLENINEFNQNSKESSKIYQEKTISNFQLKEETSGVKINKKTKDVSASQNQSEKNELIDGTPENLEAQSQATDGHYIARLFFSPFKDDAETDQCSSVYIYVDNIYPIDQMRSTVSITVETATHVKISVVSTDADMISHPNTTNPNDYYYTTKDLTDPDATPAVLLKSRATVLLKCILAELNGLYLDGVGYLQFNTNKSIEGDSVKSKAEMSLFNRRSFFGHRIRFNVGISGISESDEQGY